jgi:hypothetical protein
MPPDQLFNMLDLNGDGKITRDEYEAAIKQMQNNRPPQGGGPDAKKRSK